ncbi:hypothetical protein ACFX1Q_046048 [Malus domestica]
MLRSHGYIVMASFLDLQLLGFKNGFTITISRNDDVLLLNGVPIFFANMYYGDTLVVHSLRETFMMPRTLEDADGSSLRSGRTDDEVLFDNTKF